MRNVLFTLIFILSFSTAAFAEDCGFCRKDHKSVCKGECQAQGKEDDDTCKKDCVASKCKTACADKPAKGEKKEGKKEEHKGEKKEGKKKEGKKK